MEMQYLQTAGKYRIYRSLFHRFQHTDINSSKSWVWLLRAPPDIIVIAHAKQALTDKVQTVLYINSKAKLMKE